MENNETPKPQKKSYYEEQMERMKNDEEQKAKWRKEMQESETLKNFFKDFQPYSVQSFIDSYLPNKSLWINYGESYKDYNEDELLQWETAAFKHLGYIQQKKLFEKQCLWRAEKISIDQVEICFDFEIWEDNILNCPFIDPVSESDIELYARFLLQNNLPVDNYYLPENWQDYDVLKEAYECDNADGDYPEWYEFYDLHNGTGALLSLPDIRGEKEEFYRDLYWDSKKEETKRNHAEWEAKTDKRPSLEYYKKEFIEWYVKTFEDKETLELYQAYTWATRTHNAEEEIQDNIRLLLTAEEHVPIEAHHNWIEALERATEKYRCKKILEALPLAYERYCINIQTGIQFSETRNIKKEFRDHYTESILKGRVLNGESADFNF